MHRYTVPSHEDAYDSRDQHDHIARASSSHQNAVPQMQMNEELQGISRLFGIDAEQYLLEHAEQYEAMRKRWTSCDMEEWRKGADGEMCSMNYSLGS